MGFGSLNDDINYKSLLPCYYIEKIDKVKECA